MSDFISTVDPTGAAGAVEFVARLRRLRGRSELSYRQLARRARGHGHHLPASTLATMLGRPTLPREELVVAFITACGGGPDTVVAWVAARRRIAWSAVD